MHPSSSSSSIALLPIGSSNIISRSNSPPQSNVHTTHLHLLLQALTSNFASQSALNLQRLELLLYEKGDLHQVHGSGVEKRLGADGLKRRVDELVKEERSLSEEFEASLHTATHLRSSSSPASASTSRPPTPLLSPSASTTSPSLPPIHLPAALSLLPSSTSSSSVSNRLPYDRPAVRSVSSPVITGQASFSRHSSRPTTPLERSPLGSTPPLEATRHTSTYSLSQLPSKLIKSTPSSPPRVDEVKSRRDQTQHDEHLDPPLAISTSPPSLPGSPSTKRFPMKMKRSSTLPALPSVPSSPLPPPITDARSHSLASASSTCQTSGPSSSPPLGPPSPSITPASLSPASPESAQPFQPSPLPPHKTKSFLFPKPALPRARPASYSSSIDQTTQLSKGLSCAPGVNSPRTARLARMLLKPSRDADVATAVEGGGVMTGFSAFADEPGYRGRGGEGGEKVEEGKGEGGRSALQSPTKKIVPRSVSVSRSRGPMLALREKSVIQGGRGENGQDQDQQKEDVKEKEGQKGSRDLKLEGKELKGTVGRVQRSDSFLANLSPAKRSRLVREEVGMARKIRLWEGGRW